MNIDEVALFPTHEMAELWATFNRDRRQVDEYWFWTWFWGLVLIGVVVGALCHSGADRFEWCMFATIPWMLFEYWVSDNMEWVYRQSDYSEQVWYNDLVVSQKGWNSVLSLSATD